MWACVSVYVLVVLLDCVCVCFPLCVCFVLAFVSVHVCVREKTLRESFDSTAFLSWRHLLPSSNLSVYQAKMLSERLLRQLDNTHPPNTHTYAFSPILPASLFPASLSTAEPNNIQKSTQTHTKNHKHPCLLSYTPSLRRPLSAMLP